MSLYIPSVNEAATKIVKCYKKDAISELIEVGKYLENNDVAKAIAGNADEFHNATVELTRIGFFDYAYSLAKVGHNRYPRNTDLLGDLLCYGLRCRTIEELELWYTRLDRINKRFWTWRAYQFSFDYWMERLPYAESDEELEKWEETIEQLIEDFKNNFQYLKDKSDCEKAYMMEFEYYNSKGEEKKALNALKEATENEKTRNKCAQCALKLADRYFETGNYEEAYKCASKAVSIKEDQSSINLGYTYYILAMSLEWRERENNSIASHLQQVFNAYNAAYMHLDSDRGNHLDSVKKQVKTLEFEFGKSSAIDFDSLDKEKNGNLLELLKMLQHSEE